MSQLYSHRFFLNYLLFSTWTVLYLYFFLFLPMSMQDNSLHRVRQETFLMSLISLPASAGMLGLDWEATGEYNVDTEVSSL